MDALTSERGQALVLAAVVVALAALTVAGLRQTQDLLIERVRDERAGEAAVEAAGAVVADRLGAGADPLELVDDAAARSAALLAATEAAAANGRGAPSDVRLLLAPEAVEVELRQAGRLQRAAVPWSCCRR